MRVLSIFGSVLVLAACASGSAPVSVYGTSQGPGSSGVHNVARGENLWVVSQRYNIVMRDIVSENNLQAPFALTPGQRLILPPPREYRTRRGDSVSTVARLFDVSASEVVRINDLQPPYRLAAGQVLRLPSPVLPQAKPSITPVDDVGVARVPARIVRKDAPRAASKSVDDVVGGVLSDAPTPEVVSAPAETVVAKAAVPTPTKKPRITKKISNKPKVKKKVSTPARASSKFLRPVSGKVVSGYGPKKGGLHNDGINIAAARGTTVKAAENGVVVYAGNGLRESGNLILVRHADRWMTAYGHLDRINVRNGAVIKRGQSIGTVGSTGAVKSPQLHFEVRRGTKALNPKPYIE